VLTAVAIGAACSLIAVLLHRVVHGGRVGVTPLAAYYFIWTLMTVLTVWNPLGFVPVGARTWGAVIVAAVSLTLGYAIGVLGAPRGEGNVREAPPKPTRNLLVALLVGGGLLLLLFMSTLVRLGILIHPGVALYNLRVSLGQGTTSSVGFYFFCCFQLAVPVAALLFYSTRRIRYVFIAVTAGVALMLTSGRTKVTISLLWTAALLALLRNASSVRRRQSIMLACARSACILIFALLGNAIGKTYDNSKPFGRYGSSPQLPVSLVLPAYYLKGTLPTLDQILKTAGGEDGYRNTARPALQLARFAGAPIEVPAKIQIYYSIREPFNLSTYLSPLWRDGRYVGLTLGSFLLGLRAGAAFRWWRMRPSHATLLLTALATVTCLATALDASYTELSVWLQVLCIGLMAKAARAAAKSGTRRRQVLMPAHSLRRADMQSRPRRTR
jgi:hypothetical protein